MDFDGICDGESFDSDAYWECLLRYFAATLYHPVSTCRMGSIDDKTAVVDSQLRYIDALHVRWCGSTDLVFC